MTDTQHSEDETLDTGINCEEDGNLKPLSLTEKEALFIDDMLSLMVEFSGSQSSSGTGITTLRPLVGPLVGIPASIELQEKIGRAVLHTTDSDIKGEEAPLHLDQEDLFRLREIARTEFSLGGEPVGYNLKLKVLTALYGESYGRDKIAYRLLSQS